jgi:hypothetical protein
LLVGFARVRVSLFGDFHFFLLDEAFFLRPALINAL